MGGFTSPRALPSLQPGSRGPWGPTKLPLRPPLGLGAWPHHHPMTESALVRLQLHAVRTACESLTAALREISAFQKWQECGGPQGQCTKTEASHRPPIKGGPLLGRRGNCNAPCPPRVPNTSPRPHNTCSSEALFSGEKFVTTRM